MNKRSRSYVIADHAVANLLGAAQLSVDLGYHPNRYLTIHCERGGVQDQVHHFISRFNKQALDWLRLRSTPWCCIWVLENPRPGGLNLHLLFHVPEQYQREFAHRHRTWLRRSGLTLRPKVAKLEPVYGMGAHHEGGHYIRGLNGVLLYMMKGASDRAREALDIAERIYSAPDPGSWRKDQGIIVGKRCGTSEAIGPKMQAAFAAQLAKEIAQRRREDPWYFRLRIVRRPNWPPADPEASPIRIINRHIADDAPGASKSEDSIERGCWLG